MMAFVHGPSTGTDMMWCSVSEERHGDSSQAAAEEGTETTGQATAAIAAIAAIADTHRAG